MNLTAENIFPTFPEVENYTEEEYEIRLESIGERLFEIKDFVLGSRRNSEFNNEWLDLQEEKRVIKLRIENLEKSKCKKELLF